MNRCHYLHLLSLFSLFFSCNLFINTCINKSFLFSFHA
nr:MAG TPA: hypothetical protein [Caudoviricetes sp.]